MPKWTTVEFEDERSVTITQNVKGEIDIYCSHTASPLTRAGDINHAAKLLLHAIFGDGGKTERFDVDEDPRES